MACVIGLWALTACGFDHGTVPHDLIDAADGDGSVTDVPMIDAPMDEIVVTVASSNDDALQDPPPGNMLVGYSWMSLYTADHWGAMRFALPRVQQGAQIVEAYLDVYFDTGSTEDDPNVAITSEANANAAALISLNNNISSRPRGTAAVSWLAANLGTGWHRTPPLATIVQERVDAGGWAPGQHVMFIFDTQGPTFEMRQYDHAPAGMYAAKLTVRFVNP